MRFPNTDPNSFWTTAIRFPWFPLSTKFRKVVFPAPRNPVIIVARMRWSRSSAQRSASALSFGLSSPRSSLAARSQKMHMIPKGGVRAHAAPAGTPEKRNTAK